MNNNRNVQKVAIEMYKIKYNVGPQLIDDLFCMEYANAVWGPHCKMDQQKIERVQRRATKLIEDIKDLSYEEPLCNLNMPSLQHRRLRGDMIDTYKIVTGIYDVDKETFFKPARELGTRGHCHKLYKQHAGSIESLIRRFK